MPINIPLFTSEVKRVCNGFYAFFGQMPTMINWINEANNSKLKYKEHITWVKRHPYSTNPKALAKMHEDIIIYGDLLFYKAKGNFEDVKVPGIYYDIWTIESYKRYMSMLINWVKTGEQPRDVKNNQLRNDLFSSTRKFSKGKSTVQNHNINIINGANFTNVWSFLPPVYTPGRVQKQSYLHPTEKPIEVMKRLVEMLTPENGTVLDPFCGSGTTALACKELGRNYICIEKEPEYYQIACNRINQPIVDDFKQEYPDLIVKDESPQVQQLSLF